MGARRLKKDYKSSESEYYNNQYYVQGNRIRKPQPEQRPYGMPQGRPERTPRTSRPEKELSSINKGACFVLILAIVMSLTICINYIQAQSAVSDLNKDIIRVEKELANLKEMNKVYSEQINANLDLEEIYNTATNEYGMVRPNGDQILYFESAFSDFVKQYKEIPVDNNTGILNKIQD